MQIFEEINFLEFSKYKESCNTAHVCISDWLIESYHVTHSRFLAISLRIVPVIKDVIKVLLQFRRQEKLDNRKL